MPCPIKIHSFLYNAAEQLSQPALGFGLEAAKKYAKKVNQKFPEPVVRFYLNGDFIDRDIRISDSLVNHYYNKELNRKSDREKSELVGLMQNMNYSIREQLAALEDMQINARTSKEIRAMMDPIAHNNKEMAIEVVTKLAEKFESVFGIPYELVTEDEATQILESSPVPYNGESTFYYGDKVFFVKGKLSLNSVVHEYAHPFVRAVRKDMPELFESLYREISTTAEGEEFLKNLAKEYPELGSDQGRFQEEAIVHYLERHAANYIKDEVSDEVGYKNFLQKLTYAIRKIMRKLFPSSSVKDVLNLEDTIETVAKKLVNLNVAIETPKLTQEDIVYFKKEIADYAQDLKKVKGENLQEMINTAYAQALVSLNALKNSKDLSKKMDEVRKALERYQNIKITNDDMSDLEMVESLEKTHEEFNRRALALVNTVQDLENFAEKIESLLQEIGNNKEHFTTKGIRRVQFLKDFINSQETLIRSMQEKSGLPKSNGFYKKLNSVQNSIDTAKGKIKRLQKEAIVEFFTDENIEMNETVIQHTRERVNKIMSVNKIPQDKIDEFMDMLISTPSNKQIIISELNYPLNKTSLKELQKTVDEFLFKKVSQEEIQDYLEGRRDDVNFFSAFVVPYTNIDDPIVGAFARFSEKLKSDVQSQSLREWNEFTSELAPMLKKIGYNPNNTNQLGDLVLFEDTIGYTDSQGNFKTQKIFSFLNQFKDHRAARAELSHNFEKAREKGVKSEIKDAYKALSEFDEKYMFRSKKAEYYQLKKMFEKDNTVKNPFTKTDEFISRDIAWEAYVERQLAMEDMNLLRRAQSPYTEIEDLSTHQYTEADIAKAKYEQLFSLYNPDGSQKEGIELQKSLILREYRKKSRDFYESFPDNDKVQDDFDNFINRLATDDITPETNKELYDKYMEMFEKKNFRIAYSKEYYESRNQIMKTINELTSKVKENSDFHKAKSALYKERMELVNLYRDKNGHPNGIEYTEAQRKRLLDIEKELIALEEKFDKKTGLTKEDKSKLDLYTQALAEGRALTKQEFEEYSVLTDKANASGLTKLENSLLYDQYALLDELTKKEATEYYIDAFEYVLGDIEDLEAITIENADDWINNEEFLLKAFATNSKFETWFNENHYQKEVYDQDLQTRVVKTFRIAAWTISKPKKAEHYEKTELIHPETKEKIIINGVPSGKYNHIQVKDKYLTVPRGANREEYVGKVIDNQGNFLPRPYEPGNPESAADDKYINKEYFNLKNTNPDAFALLETLKEIHLKTQDKEVGTFAKLYYDLPRFRIKTNMEYIQSGKAREDLTDKVEAYKEYLKAVTPGGKKGADAVELELANYNVEEMLINTNLEGEPFARIPVRGLYKLDTKETSKDVLGSLSKYLYSINMNEALTKEAPITEALKDVLNDPDNAIKNMKVASKQVKNLTGAISFIPKGKGNRRADAIETYIDRLWYGQTNSDFMETNPFLTKTANILMKSASRSFIALDIPSALKNRYGMIFQSMIESASGKYYTPKSLTQGRARSAKNIWELSSSQIYSVGPKSLDVQIMENFDPITGKTKSDFGKSSSRTFIKDMIDGSFLYDFRKLAEVEAGLQIFWAMMYHKTIEQTLPDGSKKQIKYAEAFELDDKGILKLKDGIDPEYFNKPINHTVQETDTWESLSKRYNVPVEELKAKNKYTELEAGNEITIAKSSKFKSFQLKVQGVGKRLNGLMSEMDSPQAEKYLGYRLFTFYKKFATGMFLNRFQADMTEGNKWGYVYDYQLNEFHKGYYITAAQSVVKLLTNAREYYPLMSTEEKQSIQKVVTEVVGVLAMTLALSLIFGYDPDDKERFAKLKARQAEGIHGWMANHMLYQLMMVRTENEIFIPIAGFDEWAQFYDSTSIAFGPTINLYIKIMKDIIYMGFGDDRAIYKQDAGPYAWQEEGRYKLWNHLASLYGIKGKTYDPIHSIRMAEIFENLK
jgi:hypothetical protein